MKVKSLFLSLTLALFLYIDSIISNLSNYINTFPYYTKLAHFTKSDLISLTGVRQGFMKSYKSNRSESITTKSESDVRMCKNDLTASAVRWTGDCWDSIQAGSFAWQYVFNIFWSIRFRITRKYFSIFKGQYFPSKNKHRVTRIKRDFKVFQTERADI